jgi:hypothetical protein
MPPRPQRRPAEAAANGLPDAPMPLAPYWPVGQRFRSELAAEESRGSGGYAARSTSSSALGAYQFTRTALKDIGFVDKKTGAWTAKSGVTSDAEFLADPLAQERALEAYLKRGYQIAKAKGLLDYIGRNIQIEGTGEEFPVTEDGIIAAMHGVGQEWLKQYFQHLADHGWASDPQNFPLPDDARQNFTPAQNRLQKFAHIPRFRPFGH